MKPFCGGRTDASDDKGYSGVLKVVAQPLLFQSRREFQNISDKISSRPPHCYSYNQPKLHGNFSDEVEQLKEVVRLMGLTQVPL